MKNRSIIAVMTLLIILSLPPVARAENVPVQINAYSAFSGMKAGSITPIVVVIQNTGKSVNGLIEVHEDSLEGATRIYSVPIDLPSGTIKKVTVYPLTKSYGPADYKVEFDGPAEANSPTVQFEATYNDQSYQIGCIGDLKGAMQNLNDSGNFLSCYASPEDAPDRAAGYCSLSALVIGQGAERLSDAQWSAIRHWVLEGGRVIFMGGAGSLSYLDQPIPGELCPLSHLAQSVSDPIRFAIHEKSGKGRSALILPPAPIVTGPPKPGAEANSLMSSQISNASYSYSIKCGCGHVTLAECDLFAKPMRTSKECRDMLSKLITESSQSRTPSVSAAIFPMPVDDSSQTKDMNLFHVSLPKSRLVLGVYFAYFILAIPGTYILLKKRRQLELAWIVIPVVSILFALSFQIYAINLYRNKLSQVTRGIVFLSSGDPDGYSAGTTEIFFPKGGQYNIPTPGGECLENAMIEQGEDNTTTTSALSSLQTADTALGVVAFDYPVTNLSFRSFSFAAPLNAGGPITSHLTLSGSFIEGTIGNESKWTLKNAVADGPIGDIAPGQTVQYSCHLKKPLPHPNLMLSAWIPNDAIGPSAGRSVGDENGINLTMSMPLETGEEIKK